MIIGRKDFNDEKKVQSLKEHLENVAKLMKEFEKSFFNKDDVISDKVTIGYITGLVHDIGKYSYEFEEKIKKNNKKRVDHSTAGGQLYYKLYGNNIPYVSEYAIMGHHTGLPNGGTAVNLADATTLLNRLKKQIPDYKRYLKELKLPDIDEIQDPSLKFLDGYDCSFEIYFYIHMLFSTLVDADRLDAEKFSNPKHILRKEYDTIHDLHDIYFEYIKGFSNPKTKINMKRDQIFEDCIKKAEDEQGLFSLTVPTGGGKTISSLGFALKHAKKYNIDRIIYVIPYTTIIDQNAEVFSKILGSKNVLAHHSNITYDTNQDEPLKKSLSTENWDAPVIVTTNVQFFESLFSHRASDARKIHNIANSVVIFDEAQMFPISFLKPIVRSISELIYNYNTTVVLCTATQPALDDKFPQVLKRNEIIKNPKELYDFFKRVNIKEIEDGLSLDELIDLLNGEEQVLCIVNTKKFARDLHEKIEDGIHLSTNMTPQHRKLTLKKINKRLNENLPCKVISTSLIEAGVDIDFPTVYREEAGLDSIIQAAGRCNREGKKNIKDSYVYVFKQKDISRNPEYIKYPLSAFNKTKPKFEDLNSVDAIEYYFKTFFEDDPSNKDGNSKANIIMKQIKKHKNDFLFPFRDISKLFKLINEDTVTLLITKILDEETEGIINDIDKELVSKEYSKHTIRKMGEYSINIYENEKNDLLELGAIETINESIFILRDTNIYDDEMGLVIEENLGKGIFI